MNRRCPRLRAPPSGCCFIVGARKHGARSFDTVPPPGNRPCSTPPLPFALVPPRFFRSALGHPSRYRSSPLLLLPFFPAPVSFGRPLSRLRSQRKRGAGWTRSQGGRRSTFAGRRTLPMNRRAPKLDRETDFRTSPRPDGDCNMKLYPSGRQAARMTSFYQKYANPPACPRPFFFIPLRESCLSEWVIPPSTILTQPRDSGRIGATSGNAVAILLVPLRCGILVGRWGNW